MSESFSSPTASPSRLSDAQLAHLVGSLEQQRIESDTERARMAGSLADVRAARSSSDADDEHDPEGPTLSSEWSRIAGMTSELVTRAASIDRAFARVADHSYGSCVHCGNPVGFDRLDALPAADLCIECARRA